MCKLCEMKKAAEAKEKKVIGTISPALRADLIEHNKARALSDLDIEEFILKSKRALILEEIDDNEASRRQHEVDKMIAANDKRFESQHNALWDRLCDELGLTGEARKMQKDADLNTGEVTEAGFGDGLAAALGAALKSALTKPSAGGPLN